MIIKFDSNRILKGSSRNVLIFLFNMKKITLFCLLLLFYV